MKQMQRRIGRGVLFIPILIGGVFLFTWILMLLWNGILPEITGVKEISFWQAMGIFVLSKILFGFNKGWGGRHRRQRFMQDKFAGMSEEEKAAFKEKWKERWGCRRDTEQA